ncbi:MAG: hypothetical protein A2329_04905 [Sulfurimonas sp. RIFOXYB2_FULL_37_5]|jgi:hypothetical protein|uniref:hypothetical protein n=1 Tax=Sulfurimonas sp. RIFOXYB12_FULL_35_9 TaxID=1802256 RepID=UPI0008BC50EF|nr:hypothetical protein [Sulfurimonas sp. RIFOXYB12_FULL_35_9]OHE06298.1 MAG: hypothetical protein A2345_00105 [Sulfurimonas sp. RIFOXYB12_FULL_35_9]OHE11034.1 MAG: hypothetical protein A2329_04905 [Sulfurimonas sp. RIFOXYB2_FULL_37_5]
MGKYIGIEDVLTSILDILEHIKQVEGEIITMSNRSSEVFVKEIRSKSDTLTPEVLVAIQLQDIISQQFSAIAEAIESMKSHLEIHKHTLRADNAILNSNIQRLYIKMLSSLDEARNKQASFSGHSNVKTEDRDDEIDFF